MAEKIVGKYRGYDVLEHPIIRLRVSQLEFKKFIDAKEDLGLSFRQVLEQSVQPCECCKNLDITFYDRKDNHITIKRGILKIKK